MNRAERAAAIQADPRWHQVVAQDSAADGKFIYSVRTTGVYCRPSFPARLARPENVAFYSTTSAAALDGFRPCKRCRPTEQPLALRQAEVVAGVCRFIEAREDIPTLDELAAQTSMGPHHLHRLFKQVTGVTPRDYAVARRGERLRDRLKTSETVTAAIYDSGYNSNGRFYESSSQLLGMTPTQLRSGGADLEIRFAVSLSSLGAVLVAASSVGVCAISLGDEPAGLIDDLRLRFPNAKLNGAQPDFDQWVAAVVAFVDDPALGLALPLDIRGTAFQRRVWQALQENSLGFVGELSGRRRKGWCPSSCSRCRPSLWRQCDRSGHSLPPRHRTDGSLSGYRWGVDRKRVLVEREAAVANDVEPHIATRRTATDNTN